LPLIASIDDRIFCVNSGLSPNLEDIEELNSYAKCKRPFEIPDEGLLTDLVWRIRRRSIPDGNLLTVEFRILLEKM